MVIESRENKKIKYLNKLRNNKFMKEEKKFVVEGKHLVQEANDADVLVETYSITEVNYNVVNNIVSPNIMRYISTLPSTSEIIGICKFIEEKDVFGDKIIILDGVRDPGNLGTIIRSAKAFNIDTIVLSKNSVNKYNEKVIRATQGMLFKVNVIERNLLDFVPTLISDGYNVYGTDVVNGNDIKSTDKKGKIAIVMGNEGIGVSEKVRNLLKENIYININDACESLNVSVAASIIMYEISKGE